MLKHISPRRLGTQRSLNIGNVKITRAFQYTDDKSGH